MGTNKAIAAAGTGSVSGAITTLIIALFWHTASPEVAAALTTVIGTALSTAAVYLTPHGGTTP